MHIKYQKQLELDQWKWSSATKQPQKDENELQVDLARLEHTTIQCKEQLAVKSQQLSDITEQRRKEKTVSR